MENKICLTLNTSSIYQAVEQIKCFKEHNFYELRLDLYQEPLLEQIEQVGVILALYPEVKLILTLRSKSQGGMSQHSIAQKREFIQALPKTSRLVLDIENQDAKELANDLNGFICLMSWHVFTEVSIPSIALLESWVTRYPDRYFKFAIHFPSASLALEYFIHFSKHDNCILISLHPDHQFLRVLAFKFSFAWHYSYLENAAHPSQISYPSLISRYRVGSINKQTKFFALIGNPICHSISHITHNRYFAKKDINARYLKIPISEHQLELFLNLNAKNQLFEGFSVTMPLKRKVATFLDKQAMYLQTYNTLIRHESGYLACNTDALALEQACYKKNLSLSGINLLIIGAGGLALSYFNLLKDHAQNIVICCRNQKAFEPFSSFACAHFFPLENLDQLAKLQKFDLIIQSTPNGFGSKMLFPWPDSLFSKETCFIEAVAFPRWTSFLLKAKQAKAQFVSGKTLFFLQAFGQLEFWKKNSLQPQP